VGWGALGAGNPDLLRGLHFDPALGQVQWCLLVLRRADSITKRR
jgi:hypothetical protein